MILLFVLLISAPAVAQDFVVEKSTVSFFREASVEDISATNAKAAGRLNLDNGEIVFDVPVAEFEFKKSLMRKHFNEKYMESGKFPVGTFKGTVRGIAIDKTGIQSARATGQLTLHGVTREVTIDGMAEVLANRLSLRSKFTIKFEDYGIQIPELFWKTVAESVDVSVDFTFKPVQDPR